jgi:hypothetical protein
MKTFLQWIKEEENPEGSPSAATNLRTVKTKRDRDRLARIEAMLHELVGEEDQ